MYYGLLKEPDLNIPLEEEEEGGEGDGGDPANKSKVTVPMTCTVVNSYCPYILYSCQQLQKDALLKKKYIFQKRKAKKDALLMKKAKNDPNAPPQTRIPLPEL